MTLQWSQDLNLLDNHTAAHLTASSIFLNILLKQFSITGSCHHFKKRGVLGIGKNSTPPPNLAPRLVSFL